MLVLRIVVDGNIGKGTSLKLNTVDSATAEHWIGVVWLWSLLKEEYFAAG